MPDYIFSYWNGTTEVEISQKDPTAPLWDTEWWSVWEVGSTTLVGSATFVSTVNPNANLYPGSTIYPGGY